MAVTASSSQTAIPVGLIGLGKHGARYLRHIRQDVPGLRVVAVSRQNEVEGRALAREIGARFHGTAAELAADPEVRALISVVPPTLHPEVVQACVDQGRPLLIEKPFAIDAPTAFDLRDRLRRAGLPCLVGHTLRYSAVVETVCRWLSDLGRVSQILLSQSFEPSRLDWLDDPERAGGGNILHTGVHMFDLLRFFSGSEVVWANCLSDRVCTRRTEDSFSASFFLDGRGGRLLGSVAASRATRGRAGQIRVVAEAGQIVADHVHGTVALIEGRTLVREEKVPDAPTLPRLLEEFVSVVSTGAIPSIGPDQGAAAVEIASACYRSVQTGARVALLREE